MDLLTSRNVGEVVTTLKREVVKTTQENDPTMENKGVVYRNMLIRAIHGCAVRFPHVAESVVHTLMDFLGGDGGMQVIIFVRAIVEQYPELRPALIGKLFTSLDDVSTNSVMCVCLWILGEYCELADTLSEAFQEITTQLGKPPFITAKEDKEAKERAAAAAAAAGPKMITKNVVLSDGTYATQTVYSETKTLELDNTPSLRKMIVGGDVFLGSVLSSCLTKLCLRAGDMPEFDPIALKKMTTDTVLIMCGIVKMAEVTISAQRSSMADCSERITLNCRALLDPKAQKLLKPIFLSDGKKMFAHFLKTIKDREIKEAAKKREEVLTSQADDLIHFRQLRSMAVQGGDVDLDDGSDLARATGYVDANSLLSSQLNHVY
jgi:coatomer subunit beta